jgi:hypothetical protein
MAWTTPRTWVTGELVTAALLNAHIKDNLNAAFPVAVDAWTSYTPTLAQGATGNISKTVTYAKYMKVGRMVTVNILLAVTGTGTASNFVSVSLPFTAAQAGNLIAGAGWISASSVNYTGAAAINSTTTAAIIDDGGGSFLGSSGFTAALASGNTVSLSLTYEATT